jgi:L-alanine-DL-glutamate epimerase-like enolase superfamily enzyme
MRVTGIRAHALTAQLAEPMRSRGDIGYTEYFHTGSEFQRITAVEILTEGGHTGITLLSGDARPWLEAIALPALTGGDPRAVRSMRRRLVEAARAAPERFQAAARFHINRLESALWDLLAKSANQPLYRLLGGTDPWVDVYAGGGSLCWNPLPELLEETERLLDRGFLALKIKIGHGPVEDAEIIRAIRDQCSHEVRIMVDANRAYDLNGALQLLPILEEQQIGWFEEPLVYHDPADWRTLREASSIPISGGEGFHVISLASKALEEELVDLLQCDAGGFGLDALLATAAMAEEAGVALTPHCCNSVIGFVTACHLHAAIPNREAQVFETFDNPFVHSIFNERFKIVAGKIRLPEEPGLGFSFNRDVIGRHQIA